MLKMILRTPVNVKKMLRSESPHSVKRADSSKALSTGERRPSFFDLAGFDTFFLLHWQVG